jgi:NitT/TauT family transport system substrate-binding protein
MIINLLKIFLLLAFCIGSAHASENSPKELRVQLPWTHNSQFTGLYVAEFRKHFEKEGIKVKLIEGSPEKDAAKELANGNVDISINGLAGAWKASQDGAQITNVAQIVTGSAALVVCRISSGVYGPNDISGKSIGVFSDYDKAIVKELLQKNKIPEESVNFQWDGSYSGNAPDCLSL